MFYMTYALAFMRFLPPPKNGKISATETKHIFCFAFWHLQSISRIIISEYMETETKTEIHCSTDACETIFN